MKSKPKRTARTQNAAKPHAPSSAEALTSEQFIASLVAKLEAASDPKAYLLDTAVKAIDDHRAARPHGWAELCAITRERLAAAVSREDVSPSLYAVWRKYTNQERANAPEASPEEMQRAITRSVQFGLERRGITADVLPFTAEGYCSGWYRKKLEMAGEAATANAIDRDAEARIKAKRGGGDEGGSGSAPATAPAPARDAQPR